ncbi:MAG: hypothetical protein K8H74_11775 [Notoacmeibacter sp.]|nr:hypothetical protein [Notoacmeibacter sp.]
MIDEAVPVLARMSGKRIKGYRSLGISLGMKEETPGAEGSDEGGFLSRESGDFNIASLP